MYLFDGDTPTALRLGATASAGDAGQPAPINSPYTSINSSIVLMKFISNTTTDGPKCVGFVANYKSLPRASVYYYIMHIDLAVYSQLNELSRIFISK